MLLTQLNKLLWIFSFLKTKTINWHYNLLFLITIADTNVEIEKLIQSLKLLSNHKKNNIFKTNNLLNIPNSKLILTPREAFFSSTKTVKLTDSVNKICAEEVTFYPPGVPILCPGELITAEIIEQIQLNKNIGIKIIGATDKFLNNIKIINI